jgi:flagella basal body P-ring formation protein FlgA
MFRIALPTSIKLLCLSSLMSLAAAAVASQGLSESFAREVHQWAMQGARASAPAKARIEITLGELSPRLRLAPCQKLEPHLLNGHPMWGRTRIGLRCVQGAVRWDVTLPLTVQVFSRALVAKTPLPAGAILSQENLREAEVDVAAEGGSTYTSAEQLIGRELQRALAAGEAVNSKLLKQRRWFAAGDTVRVRAIGNGYAVESEGRALNPGLDEQEVRVRFDSGRVVTGRAMAERMVEVLL